MGLLQKFQTDGGNGIRLAINVFISTALLWVLLYQVAGVDPIWAISSMLVSSNPDVKQTLRNFWSPIVNTLLGCGVGLLVLLGGGSGDWKFPLALAITVLLSAYVVRVPVMWSQAPVTAALVVSAGLMQHSGVKGIETGLQRVGEVLLGCLIGVLVSWLMARIWESRRGNETDTGVA